jgi:hypothetical protein
MNPIRGAVRAVTNTANAAAAAAGAVGGAAVSGVIGGVQGTAQGVRNGLANGTHSTPAAALTFAALGATGLVEWPVLLTVGGAVILVRQLTRQSDERRAATAPASSGRPRIAAVKTEPAKDVNSRPAKAVNSGPAKKAPAKKTAARKATSRRAASSRQT